MHAQDISVVIEIALVVGSIRITDLIFVLFSLTITDPKSKLLQYHKHTVRIGIEMMTFTGILKFEELYEHISKL